MKFPVFVVWMSLVWMLSLCRRVEAAEGVKGIALKTLEGKATSTEAWAGKVLLVVNVASQCGHTPQYAGLEALHQKYREKGFSVLGFPSNDFGAQEPGTAEEIRKFCKSRYKVTFPLFEKVRVTGERKHPLYAALTGKGSPVPGEVSWNFGKFLIGRDGKILKRWEPDVLPEAKEITEAIETALLAKGTVTAPGGVVKGVSVFGTPATGNRVIFCLDTGTNMKSLCEADGIAAVRREMKRVITELPGEIAFNIVCYGTCADLFKADCVPATDETKTEAVAFLEGYYGTGKTAFGRTRTEKFQRAGKDGEDIAYVPVMPEDIKELEGIGGPNRVDLALAVAFQRSPATVFLISAGVPRPKKGEEEMEPQEVIDAIFAAYEKITEGKDKVTVHVTSIHSETLEGSDGRKFLAKLAAKFGGKHKDVRAPKLKEEVPAEKGPKRAKSGPQT